MEGPLASLPLPFFSRYIFVWALTHLFTLQGRFIPKKIPVAGRLYHLRLCSPLEPKPIAKMSRHPTTKWAQRSDKVYITIELPDAKDVKLNLQPDGHFYFFATSGTDNTPYEIDFELLDKVNVEESKAAIGLRNICYLVKKAEKKWWSRLLKKEGKPPVFLKVDWDKWIDEDDENENIGDMDFGDMDFSKLDMGGADDELEDDGADAIDRDGEDEMEENKAEGCNAEESREEVAQAAATNESEAKA